MSKLVVPPCSTLRVRVVNMLTSFEPATCHRLAPCGFPVGRGVAHQHNAVGGPEGICTRPKQAQAPARRSFGFEQVAFYGRDRFATFISNFMTTSSIQPMLPLYKKVGKNELLTILTNYSPQKHSPIG